MAKSAKWYTGRTTPMREPTRLAGEVPPGQSGPPSEEWTEAFHAQCLKPMLASVLHFAQKRARLVRRVNSAADDYYARELLSDALDDTLEGKLRWEPSVRSLEDHLCLAILSRSNHDYERARRYRHESLDQDEAPAELVAKVEAALLERSPNRSTETELADRQRLAQLRALVADDPVALRILNAIEDPTVKASIAAHTGISTKEYHAARERLIRLAKKIPR